MQGKGIWGGSILAAITVGLTACIGSLDGSPAHDSDVVGEHAAIVAKKREWLQNYDGHCNVCFEAFELCQKAAESQGVLDACEVAMNTCVRAGLVDQDAGTVGEDASVEDEANQDRDAGNEADFDEDADVVDDDSIFDEEDAGAGQRDAGRGRGSRRRDAGANLETDASFADAADAGSLVDQGDAGGAQSADDSKAQLVENIQACLATAGACLNGGEPAQCLGALRTCVKTTLQSTFQNVCTRQIGACRNERGPRPALESVERICARNLQD
ncbi:MAG TPA: hypothetical protein VI299_09200 [Polyangiales bacterium]